MTGRGVASLPGFAESLRLLIEREQYAQTDIALMFGVSRERIRQLVARFGLTEAATQYAPGLDAERVWCDATHRFYPRAKKALRLERAAASRQQRITQRRTNLTRRRTYMALTYRQLHAEYGMAPTLAQWATRVFGVAVPVGQAGARLCAYWGADPGQRGTTVAGRLAHIRQLVQAPPARRGAKQCTLYCTHGHPMFGDALLWYTTNDGRMVRQCKTCRRERDERRR